jgi:DNA-binding CsgD family transcriptional regulator
MDAWISAGADTDGADILCDSVLDYLAPDTVLTVTETAATDPLNWTLSLVRGYEVPSGLAAILPIGMNLPFHSLPDRHFTVGTLIAGRQRAIAQARPEVDNIDACLSSVRIFGDRVILPARNPEHLGSWCVSLVRIRCLLPMAEKGYEPDATDLAILQLLREGYSARNIGSLVGLSHRTVEHKLEKLKATFGARSVAHLATLSIASTIGPR